ncbi:hypothetical protein PAMP_022557 [Pampus punctatissimus]
MEEAVTRKFVHEDSSHIVSFCVALVTTHPLSDAVCIEMRVSGGWERSLAILTREQLASSIMATLISCPGRV